MLYMFAYIFSVRIRLHMSQLEPIKTEVLKEIKLLHKESNSHISKN